MRDDEGPRGLKAVSIRTRLVLLIGFVTSAAMVAFASLALQSEQLVARRGLQAEQRALAAVVANRSAAALLFGDAELARENLAALADVPHVRSACLYGEDGRLFAEFSSAGVAAPSPCPVGREASLDAVTPPDLQRVVVDVEAGSGGAAGTLLLDSRLELLEARFREQIRRWGSIGATALVIALALAFLLERVITGPVRRLARVAERIVESGDTTARAGIESRDEVGELALAFNRMLDRLEAQARGLREQADYNQVLFQKSPLPVIVVDARRNLCIAANDAAVRMYGFGSLEETMAAGVREVSAPVQYDGTPSEEAIIPHKAAALSGEPRVYEWRHRRPDGSEFDAEVHLIRFGADDAPMLLASLFDITDRKAAANALREMNEALETRVADRTRDLATANATLSRTVEQLRQAQDELVRSERLASLGALVAGVAHELNTPLGSVLLVATTLGDGLEELREKLDRGDLKRSTLAEFLAQQTDAQSLIVRNAKRAADLIQRFKQVAVDQTSEQRRAFDLAEVVVEVIATLQPRLRKTSHHVEIAIEEGLVMDSYPGPLGQVLTNLVMNAMVHGLGDQAGRVRIAAWADGDDDLVLEVADDGVGIPADHLPRIFDPFFTTKLGEGGSGLGLHIVFSLVERMLGGRIDVSSVPGQGATFRLRLPRKAPGGSGG